MNNKEKNARIVVFKADYISNAAKAAAAKTKTTATPIYREGQEVAMHKNLAKALEAKGAKMHVKELNVEAGVKRLKAKKKQNEKALIK